jgi:programmed cell death protein 5
MRIAMMTVSRIALVRPQRAQGIEDLLMRMAKGGQLRGQVSEEQLIGVLDQVSLSSELVSSSCQI